MAKKYRVTLTCEERRELEGWVNKGKSEARKLAHARILLQADEAEGGPCRTDDEIARALNVHVRTVERVRQRFVEHGLPAALVPKPSERVYPRRLDGAQEARLIALACLPPPEGKPRWTLRLLAERLVELEMAETVSYETVRRVLKKQTQTAPLQAVSHSAKSLGGVCRGHGTRVGGLSAAVPERTAGRLFGRDFHPVDRRGPRAAAEGAGAGGTL